ncbi:hypothetical protein [Vitreoscilla sp. C1]|uniref:hypothetical protein n=1 Tax=Vitreoscilla sp. (strain C1) TaxID=96942 RepID=UPI00131A322E|nr:hypothetical protein [Vitreoscilla sp. C1]
MMMFKKIALIFGLSLSSISMNSSADDALPIQTIQSLYSHSMEMSKHIEHFSNNELLVKFATPSLKKVFNADSAYVSKSKELGCLDHDVMWQTNDSAEGANLYLQQVDYKFIVVGIGATEGLEARSITYEMSCNANECKIDDLWYEDQSFKEGMTACLKELKAL